LPQTEPVVVEVDPAESADTEDQEPKKASEDEQ
jgi:hypothetical protein